jgi:hypothetical protein
LRTTNGLERINKEINGRACVASIFPNSESCLRLVPDQQAIDAFIGGAAVTSAGVGGFKTTPESIFSSYGY